LALTSPEVYAVTPSLRVMRLQGTTKVPLAFPAGSPLLGRPHGRSIKTRAFLRAWAQAFEAFCHGRGLIRMFRMTQGCVVEKTDGGFFQMMNFVNNAEWMTREVPFWCVRRVYHSPFAAVRPR
jgi:hypothetical protein